MLNTEVEAFEPTRAPKRERIRPASHRGHKLARAFQVHYDPLGRNICLRTYRVRPCRNAVWGRAGGLACDEEVAIFPRLLIHVEHGSGFANSHPCSPLTVISGEADSVTGRG